MAGDWIKMRCDLARDLAVIGIARRTGLNRFEVVGCLHSVWSWADQQLRDGNANGVTSAFIDDEIHHPGFAQAMSDEGWLKILSTGFSFPNFDRHNGKPAKERALTAQRMKRLRDANNVTKPSTEKRREEKNINNRFHSADSTAPATDGKAVIEDSTPKPDALAIIIAELKRSRVIGIEESAGIIDRWVRREVTTSQIARALMQVKLGNGELTSVAYLDPIVERVAKQDREISAGATAKVQRTQEQIAEMREDAKDVAPPPDGFFDKNRSRKNAA